MLKQIVIVDTIHRLYSVPYFDPEVPSDITGLTPRDYAEFIAMKAKHGIKDDSSFQRWYVVNHDVIGGLVKRPKIINRNYKVNERKKKKKHR